ncbi:MAG TPA: prepilin-type N-terminal cleavage/methylation domain-containing protein [Candidatus Acidoferrum sp.]|nr:prepilin-type N-terminal cleavage/methylation domain-containing protein [Candidatus Acidoferrum sp.]
MRSRNRHGFTLVELVITIALTAILITVAMKSVAVLSRTSREEETKQKLEAIAFAISGNPSLVNNGVRSDFGYVGDIGALPSNLDNLCTNPGYATWKGPYVSSRFVQSTNDFKQDAWGANLQYSGGVTITSTGSGSNITRTIANATSDLLSNGVSGSVSDISGTPPGNGYKDSIAVFLTVPDGSGGTTVRQNSPNASGYFAFSSVPIGNHDLQIIYKPTSDTLKRFVSVTPGATVSGDYKFASSLWYATAGIVMVPNSDSVSGSPPCTDISFWITNNSGSSRTITSISASWPSPAAYYARIYWGSTAVFDMGGSPRGQNGVTYSLSPAQTIAAGALVKIRITDFRANNSNGGGSPESMSGNTITVLMSDGSTITELLPSCP